MFQLNMLNELGQIAIRIHPVSELPSSEKQIVL